MVIVTMKGHYHRVVVPVQGYHLLHKKHMSKLSSQIMIQIYSKLVTTDQTRRQKLIATPIIDVHSVTGLP